LLPSLLPGENDGLEKYRNLDRLRFYLLLAPDGKQAIFLPRAAVRAINFVSL
jgi:hypothetical protein